MAFYCTFTLSHWHYHCMDSCGSLEMDSRGSGPKHRREHWLLHIGISTVFHDTFTFCSYNSEYFDVRGGLENKKCGRCILRGFLDFYTRCSPAGGESGLFQPSSFNAVVICLPLLKSFPLSYIYFKIVVIAVPLLIILQTVSSDGRFFGSLLLAGAFPASTLTLIFVPKVVSHYKALRGVDMDNTQRRARGSAAGVHVSGLNPTNSRVSSGVPIPPNREIVNRMGDKDNDNNEEEPSNLPGNNGAVITNNAAARPLQMPSDEAKDDLQHDTSSFHG